MGELCGLLQSDVLDHPVVDQTGLGAARYGGLLKYQMDDNQAIKMGMPKAPPPPDTGDVPPPLMTALAEQFGLRLESGKGARGCDRGGQRLEAHAKLELGQEARNFEL